MPRCASWPGPAAGYITGGVIDLADGIGV